MIIPPHDLGRTQRRHVDLACTPASDMVEGSLANAVDDTLVYFCATLVQSELVTSILSPSSGAPPYKVHGMLCIDH